LFVLSSPKAERWGIMAVALEETQIELLSLEELMSQILDQDQQALSWLETWIKNISKWIINQIPLSQRPLNLIRAEGSHFLSFVKDQCLSLSLEEKQILWIDLRQGIAHWMGMEPLILDSNSPLFPLGKGIWLQGANPVEVYTIPTQELENPAQVREGLALLHYYFFDYFYHLQEQKIEAKFQQFQARKNFNRQVVESALSGLAMVVKPQEKGFLEEVTGNSLLKAVGAVGRALGIKISAPPASEDFSRVKDPVEAIARVSQIPLRHVLLAGEWWKQEHGPLLAYTRKEKRPVALLPNQKTNYGLARNKSNYILYDPESEQKIEVNPKVAEDIAFEAYMFYRPLPTSIDRALDIFRFGIKGYEKDLIAVFVLGVVSTLLGMITPQATAMIVNNAIPDSDRILLWQIGLALFAAAIGQSAFQMAQGIVSLRVENAADSNLQPSVWNRMMKLSPAFFRQYASGDLVNRLLAVSQIRQQLSGATQRSLLSGVFAVLNLGLMFVYSWKLAIVALFLTIFLVIVTVTSTRFLVKKQRQREDLDGQINGLTVELINGVAKLRVAAAEERAFAAWANKYRMRTLLTSGIQRINDSVAIFNEVLPLVSSVLLFWFAIFFINMAQAKGLGDVLTTGAFLAFNAAFGIFINGVTELSNTFTEILEIVPLWERAKPIVKSPPESDPSKADPGRLNGRISLDHVTFRYRDDGPLILDDVSIYAEPGEFVAIVGPSGSGKSTVFRLLLGFEHPLSGTVYYDGQDLAGLDIQAVRRQLGVVLQNVRISAGTLFDTIAAGALISLDEAWEAARMSGFAEDIQQMPMGMHTVISEGATNLSGGQKQRLLIARAVVLKPKIILMDEATSALDNRTQSIVTKSLDQLNATRVVIAHRLSTIRNADRIYVVEAGRVVQVGSFDDLLKQEGPFAKLAARQLE
jgi:NHLM bacteriocin system ABC transporter ATP-binding protein